LKAALIAQGVWVRPFRNIVYLTPAFTMGAGELDALCDAITLVLHTQR
jgi:adenosylmethionine-8-amino-7-oxononanoate aminotransferase